MSMGYFKNRKVLLAFIIVMLTIMMFIVGFFLFNGQKTNLTPKNNHQEYFDNWTMTIGEESETHPDFPSRITIPIGEAATLTNTLPENIPERHAILARNYHLWLKAYVGDELIFSYPNEDWNRFGNIISDEWCLIEIDPKYSGQEIKFIYSNTSDFPFIGTIGHIYYGEDNSLVLYVKNSSRPNVILGIVLCVIGALLLLVSYIYRGHTNQSPNTGMGLAFLCFGIWLTNRAKMGIFPYHSIYVYWASLICLMFVAPALFLYSYFRNQKFKKLSFWGTIGCIIGDVVLVVSCFIINYNVELIAMFAYGLSIIALALNAYSLFCGGFGKESRSKTSIERLLDRTEFVSNLIFPVILIFELAIYQTGNRDYLWTDASIYLRGAMTLYAFLYMGFVLWRTFLVVQDRTIVTKKLHDSQLELMMGQIQPHFIFNTLSSIRTLVMVDPKVAYNMLYDFSNYLRANIDNVTNMDGISFASEVSHIKSYVNIEKVRFGDKLEVEYDIQAENFTVPPLSIQPLVENAIKHGVCKKIYGGTVILKSYEEGDFNVVEVSDDGIGFNSETASKVFAFPDTTNGENAESAKLVESLLKGISGSLILRDKDGDTLAIKERDETPDLSGNGSEKHNSKGMMNILLRLREMANAKVEIRSQEDVGTQIRVLFPKDYKPV